MSGCTIDPNKDFVQSFTIDCVNNRSIEWDRDKVIITLQGLASAEKDKVWVRKDLSTSASNCLTRFFWTVICKRFDCLRALYGVDLDESKTILERIKVQIDNDDQDLKKIFDAATEKFNEIAPRYTVASFKDGEMKGEDDPHIENSEEIEVVAEGSLSRSEGSPGRSPIRVEKAADDLLTKKADDECDSNGSPFQREINLFDKFVVDLSEDEETSDASRKDFALSREDIEAYLDHARSFPREDAESGCSEPGPSSPLQSTVIPLREVAEGLSEGGETFEELVEKYLDAEPSAESSSSGPAPSNPPQSTATPLREDVEDLSEGEETFDGPYLALEPPVGSSRQSAYSIPLEGRGCKKGLLSLSAKKPHDEIPLVGMKARYTMSDGKSLDITINGMLEATRDIGNQEDHLSFDGTITIKRPTDENKTTYNVKRKAVVPDANPLSVDELCALLYEKLMGSIKVFGKKSVADLFASLPKSNIAKTGDFPLANINSDESRKQLKKLDNLLHGLCILAQMFDEGNLSQEQIDSRVEELDGKFHSLLSYWFSLSQNDPLNQNDPLKEYLSLRLENIYSCLKYYSEEATEELEISDRLEQLNGIITQEDVAAGTGFLIETMEIFADFKRKSFNPKVNNSCSIVFLNEKIKALASITADPELKAKMREFSQIIATVNIKKNLDSLLNTTDGKRDHVVLCVAKGAVYLADEKGKSKGTNDLRGFLSELYGRDITEAILRSQRINNEKPITVGKLKNILFDHLLGSQNKKTLNRLDERDNLILTPLMKELDEAASIEGSSDEGFFLVNVEEPELIFKGNTIVKVAGAPTEARKGAKARFLQMMTDTYGKGLTRALIPYYGLHTWYYDDTKPLNWSLIKRVLVGVAANVTVSDLRELHQRLGGKSGEPMLCAEYLIARVGKERCNSIGNTNFEELNAEELVLLESAFRSLPDSKGGSAWVHDRLFPDNATHVEPDQFDPFEHDLTFMKTIAKAYKLKLEGEAGEKLSCRHHLAASEQVAKSLVYTELKEGMIFTLPNKNNEQQLFHVARSLERKRDALICDLLAPVNPLQSVESQQYELFLTFRGSWLAKNRIDSGATWVRNARGGGVGRREFEKRKDEIIAMLENYILSLPEEVRKKGITLNIDGHSLGAADTQGGIGAILTAVSNSSEDSPLRAIRTINTTTHNPPKGNFTLNEDGKTAVTRLANDFRDPPQVYIRHVLFKDKNRPDPVQGFGKVLFGADYAGGNQGDVFNKAEFIHRSVIYVEQLGSGGYIEPHTSAAFVEGGSRFPIRITELRDDNPKDLEEMEMVMADTYYFNPDPNYMSRLAASSSWFLRSSGHQLVRVLHSMFGYGVAFGYSFAKHKDPALSRTKPLRIKAAGSHLSAGSTSRG